MSDYLSIKWAANVGELRKALKGLPSDMLVIQSRDEEGNGFLPLMGVGVCYYLPKEDTVLSTSGGTPAEENHAAVCLWPAHDWQHAQMVAEARFPKEPTTGEENGI